MNKGLLALHFVYIIQRSQAEVQWQMRDLLYLKFFLAEIAQVLGVIGRRDGDGWPDHLWVVVRGKRQQQRQGGGGEIVFEHQFFRGGGKNRLPANNCRKY